MILRLRRFLPESETSADRIRDDIRLLEQRRRTSGRVEDDAVVPSETFRYNGTDSLTAHPTETRREGGEKGVV